MAHTPWDEEVGEEAEEGEETLDVPRKASSFWQALVEGPRQPALRRRQVYAVCARWRCSRPGTMGTCFDIESTP